MRRARIVLCLGFIAVAAGCLAYHLTASADEPKPGGPASPSCTGRAVLTEEQRQTQVLVEQVKAALRAEDYSKVASLLTQALSTNAPIRDALRQSLELETLGKAQRSAEQGNPGAQLYLGQLRTYGIGLAQDNAEAVKLYRKAADQGFALAHTTWSYDIWRARASRRTTRGRELYREAADQGLAAAQFNLGIMYMSGAGVVQDKAKAVEFTARRLNREMLTRKLAWASSIA